MSTKDETPRSSPPAPADLDSKIDRIAGLSAQAVMQIERLVRIISASHSLDARSRREMQDALAENRAVLAQLRDGRQALVKAASEDDRITASFALQLRGGGDAKKKIRDKLIVAALTIGGAIIGAIVRHLAGR